MKIRPILLALLLVGGFVFFTTRWAPLRLPEPASLWTSPAPAHSATLTPEENSNIAIYRTASPATVFISSTVYQRDWFFQIYPVRESGSGFLIDDTGRILTNFHVVSGNAKAIEVTLPDKSQHTARLLGYDQRNDMALIKIQPRGKVPFLKPGDSSGLQVGQKVLAIGNPFGLEGTLTTGIISSLNRTIRDENGRELADMIQTDAAINPGNSGGPLLDSQGNVIGINTAIYGPGSNIGIGFAIPINRAKFMLTDLASRGRVARPLLGVTTGFLSAELAEALDLPARPGLLIQKVDPASAAEQAGLRGATREVVVGNYVIEVGGDFIIEVDGQPVNDRSVLTRAMEHKRAGEPLKLTIVRGRRTLTVTVTLGEAPQKL
ncbi:MAG: trypsin-like peptidase domain-containing protein [Acidobacteria bacterium]|nr:trypsin-like peptidase domain-containing protein [Acidobacteriota bacterium]